MSSRITYDDALASLGAMFPDIERGALEARCREVVDASRAKLERVYRAYTKARERLVEALRAKEGAEADARELQHKYALKAW